jgi:hypothetical protein
MFYYTETLKNSKYYSVKQLFLLRLAFTLFLTENNFAIKGKITSPVEDYSVFEQYYKSSVTVAVRRLSLN